MSDRLPTEQVARQDFSLSFRGYDQQEVRTHLARVAAELTAAREREDELTARIDELEAARDVMPDESVLETVLGREAMRVLHAAREAAAEIRSSAETSSTTMVTEAEATRDKTLAEAEQAAAVIRAKAAASATAQREKSEERAEEILAEAQRKAERIIADATAAREALNVELDRLRAARERLIASFEEVRRSLGIAETIELADTEPLAEPEAEPETAAAPSNEPLPALPEPHAVEPVSEVTPAEEPAADEDTATDPERVELAVVPSPPPAAASADDRRSSSLRLVRAGGTPVAPEADRDIEGVRIIGPVASEPAADVEVDAADAEVESTDAAVGAEVEPVGDTSEDAPQVADDVGGGIDDAGASDHDDKPAVVEATTEAAAAAAPVEDLFSRLRADRAEKLARATTVLAAPETNGDAAPEDVTVDAPSEVDADEGDALEPDLAVLAARDEAVADAERALVRSLKRALADEQNEVLDALRRLRGRPALDALLPDVAVHDARYEAVLGTAAHAAAAAGGAGGGGKDVAMSLGHTLAGDLRARVDRAIDDAGGDVETLAEAISAAYREWKTARAEPLARDVIAAGFAAGTYEAATGPLRWIVDPAEGGCPDCDDNVLAGPTEKGLPFPTGQLRPPAHAGCRCLAVPVG
jgi:DivIVA domain-containing protein